MGRLSPGATSSEMHLVPTLDPRDVERIVAIDHSDPHTVLGIHRVGDVTVVRAFRPNDETILTLGRDASVNGRIVSVFGPWDPHIPEGSSLDGATNIAVPTAGHFRVLGAAATVRAVLDGIAILSRGDVSAD